MSGLPIGMNRLILSLVVLFLVGCEPLGWSHPRTNGTWLPPSYAYVCLELPESQIPAAKEALAMWDRSLRQWRRFVPVEGRQQPCTYWVHETTRPLPSDATALAWTTVGGMEIVLLRGSYEHDTAGLLMHELGHAMGAQHVPGTLMRPQWHRGGYVCPDAYTVAQVAAYNRVSIDLLSWCVL